MTKYPNLEKLENATRALYERDDLILRERIKDNEPIFEAHMFPQTWGSTALGFDDTIAYGGQTMTVAYTVVFHELVSETYTVFFNEELAYIVHNPSEIFYADFARQKLQSVKLAKKLY